MKEKRRYSLSSISMKFLMINMKVTLFDMKKTIEEEVKFSRNELFEFRETLPDEVDTFPLTFPKFPIKREEPERKVGPSSLLYPSSSHPFSASLTPENISASSLSAQMQTTTTNPSVPSERPHIPNWLPPFPHPRTYKQTSLTESDPSQTTKLRPKRKRQSENGENPIVFFFVHNNILPSDLQFILQHFNCCEF